MKFKHLLYSKSIIIFFLIDRWKFHYWEMQQMLVQFAFILWFLRSTYLILIFTKITVIEVIFYIVYLLLISRRIRGRYRYTIVNVNKTVDSLTLSHSIYMPRVFVIFNTKVSIISTVVKVSSKFPRDLLRRVTREIIIKIIVRVCNIICLECDK